MEGFFERWESWKDGRRQPASVAYQVASCSNVTIQTNTMVQRILFEAKKAVGVETMDASGNTLVFKSAEVVVSAGTFRSAQLLLVSGIGPAQTLQTHSIPIVHENPHVGTNLHDHFVVPLYWKLKIPDSAVGSCAFQGPAYQIGLPGDYLALYHDPEVAIAAKAEGASEEEVQFLANEKVCHTEVLMNYAAAGLGTTQLESDGMTVTTMIVDMIPTSRGTITIASSDISTYPVVDPNVYATKADCTAVRNAVRKVLHMLTATELGNLIIDHELTDYPGHSDEDIDKRVAQWGMPFYHPGGTCSMGTVIDTECRVIGMDGLRVVDASILPVPICAHYQAVVYAVAERAADLI
jgi:choline dehydrogenase-like flavoprotein